MDVWKSATPNYKVVCQLARHWNARRCKLLRRPCSSVWRSCQRRCVVVRSRQRQPKALTSATQHQADVFIDDMLNNAKPRKQASTTYYTTAVCGQGRTPPAAAPQRS